MKNELKPIVISTIISISLILGSTILASNVLANSQNSVNTLSESLTSNGKLEYTNTETNEKVVIDAADHITLATAIETNSENINTNAENISSLELTVNDNYSTLSEEINSLGNLTENGNEEVKKYQRYVNTELDYGYFTLSDNINVSDGEIVKFDLVKDSNNIHLSDGKIQLKGGKTYEIIFSTYCGNIADNNSGFYIYNETDSNIIAKKITLPIDFNASWNTANDINCIFSPEKDCEISINVFGKSKMIIANESTSLTVKEINRQIVIDPVEHVNTTQGIEDTPVGHIINHMGTIAPDHYLICDGSVYNINDYPYLSQHIKDNFGTYSYFGGDGTTTFAVPDLRGEFLRGTGTATRDTGSGGEIGEHQNPTEHIYIGRHSNGNFEIPDGHVFSLEQDKITKNGNKLGLVRDITTYTGNSSSIESYTSRPTNTSVLYCIKYEPTYFMVNHAEPEIYSYNERCIGSWVNGKPLYEKTIYFGSLANAGTKSVAHNIENVDTIWINDGFVKASNGTVNSLNFPHRDGTQYSWRFNVTKESISNNTGSHDRSTDTAYVTVRYTKTTDAENSFNSNMLSTY